MSPEQIKARCEWMMERRQGDEPIWTSAQMLPILNEYLRTMDDLARVRTGIS